MTFGQHLLASMRAWRKAQGSSVIPDQAWSDEVDRLHDLWMAQNRVAKLRKRPFQASPDLEAIYAAYPRHVARETALRAIDRALGGAVTINWLKERVRLYAACVERWSKEDRAFVPHPATWFNQQRFSDDEAEWKAKMTRPASSAPEIPPEPAGWLDLMRAEYPTWVEFDEGRTPKWERLKPYQRGHVLDGMRQHSQIST